MHAAHELSVWPCVWSQLGYLPVQGQVRVAEVRAARSLAQRLAEDNGDVKPLTKKEKAKQLEEKRQKKQGTRLRKQGAKANKFDAEAAGKKANKKNGLLH